MSIDLNGNIINSLSEEQLDELLRAYEESFDENNLMPHEVVRREHDKWLKADQ